MADVAPKNLVIGVGIGVFVLGFLWVLSIIVCIFLSRASSPFRYIGVSILVATAILTGILLAIPRESSSEDIEEIKVYDYSIIYRSLLIAVLIITIIVSLVLYFVKHIMQPVFAKPLKKVR